MKYISLILLSFLVYSCKTVELTDGTRITKRQERKIFEKAFNDSFGQMTEEEVLLFEGVTFQVDTSVINVPVDTVQKYNIFLIYTNDSLGVHQQRVPVGHDLFEYFEPGTIEIVDTLEYYAK